MHYLAKYFQRLWTICLGGQGRQFHIKVVGQHRVKRAKTDKTGGLGAALFQLIYSNWVKKQCSKCSICPTYSDAPAWGV